MADSKILGALKESTANSGPLRHPKPNAKFTLIPGSDQTREIDNLSGPELIYNFLKSCGKEVIGDPTTAFAVYDECDGILRTYGKPLYRDEANEYPWIKGKFQALEKAQGVGASFHGSDGQVTCVLNGVTAQGGDYAEAAMRAWLKKAGSEL